MDWIEKEKRLTPHDRELLLEAEGMDWTETADLEDEMETPEGREFMHDLTRRKYHAEEFAAGMD